MSSTRPSIQQATTYLRKADNVVATFYPANPLVDSGIAGPTVLKPGGIVCEMVNMDDMTLTPRNEREIVGPGKEPSDLINDGYELERFPMTMHGNALVTLAALQGQNMRKAGSHGYDWNANSSLMGALKIVGYNDAGEEVSTLIFDQVYMTSTTMPGAPTTDDGAITVNFHHKNPVVVGLVYPFTAAVEIYYDNAASITNANIVSVANVDLGGGNQSVATATTDLDAADLFSGRTGAARYFIGVQRDGVRLNMKTMTYTPAVAAASNGNLAFGFTTGAGGEYWIIIYAFELNRAGYTDNTETPGVRADLLNSSAKDVYGGTFQGFSTFVQG